MSNPTLDPRLNAIRDDLVASDLHQYFPDREAARAIPARCITTLANLKRHPSDTAANDKQLLFGEDVYVFEKKNGWVWLQSQFDQYVGYCKEAHLTFDVQNVAKTHRVSSLRTPVFAAPDIKSNIQMLLSINSEITVTETPISENKGKFSYLQDIGWIFSDHLCPLDQFSHDFIAAAKLFFNAPYIWGGNSDLGLDCSGLIQIAAYAAGYKIPRDADMQEAFFEDAVDMKDIKFGDLLFWPGHVAIYLSNDAVLHANATQLSVGYHPLEFLIAHIEKQENTPLRAIKRPHFEIKT
ncbi:MAG: C40 family peptidase [Alphaproteobacteria bacterium]|nr:C40 family peptidase [Alphaproteobacteria bacterium]